ncbi:GNAT family N-acetyltransferase [Streptomyces sp. SID13726]|uniref:GNAT family N-acetyltransferase n=1 Tax=Streptomyces sp. SID13726 TaxID=2706058 RepID=UPI0013BB2EAE|nr:GNAT family N-acetyltransferase [Streptomyces sp. SID13726]NEB00869.1 GNAT family N-acetyltransferase [Streptomyces sp. SID13726]
MGQRTGSLPAVRRAVEHDLVELLRLHAPPSEALDDDGLDALAVVLRRQLDSDAVRVLVVDGAGERLAACGIGTIEQRLPGPGLSDGRTGQVIGVAADPDQRRPGPSRAVLRGLLDWFGEHEIARVDLHTPGADEPLYRELGFTSHPDPALSWSPAADRAVTPSR